MRHGSLFSGIGGFDLAAQWMGWENVFHCEWNEFGQKVLKHYWPNAISYHDITKTDFTIHRGDIDILTGGFPCQPYSMAGKRKGKEDERHLWPEMLRAIREIRPRWVVGENVLGLVNWSGGLVFHEVQADLEASGYEVWPYVLPAVSVNAPHRRDRVWFVAYSKSAGTRQDIGGLRCMSHRYCERLQNASNSYSNGQQRSDSEHEINPSEGRFDAQRDFEQSFDDGDALYSDISIKQRKHFSQTRKRKFDRSDSRNGINNFETFPTVSPICNGDDGISDRLDAITFSKWRNESIKAGGNAIVPQVAHQIFKAIQEYELIQLQSDRHESHRR